MIDPVEFGKAMGAIVREVTAPLIARIDQLEKALSERPDLEAVAKQAAALIPVPKDGEPGRDADMGVLKAYMGELVAALPVPQDGKSVNLEDVRPVLDEAIKALRADAEKILADPLELAEQARDSLLKALGELKQPADGQSVTAEDVAPLIREEVAKAVAEVPPAKDGESVTAEDVRPLLAELVGEAVKALPPAEKGKDADMDALRSHLGELVKSMQLPAAPTVDEVAATFERRFSDLTLSWERQARDTFEKAADRMPKPQDGRDALPLESFDMVLGEDGRTVTVKLQAGETVIKKSVKIPAVIDRDTYKHDGTYEKGDGVSYGGSFWIAKCDNPQGVPGSGETDWRCAVKKGRDGKDLRDNASRHDPSKGVSIK
ncbi:hypothetical protein [Azotobacter chroococcum]|uniref:Phage portal protein n=1 Tax=Azotobacter chroococcum TaxID=353 RepID=A0AAQ0C0T4_9GAMM|nr:hypothetical protein [Azotobacter chroococcum]QQE90479.1 hypothetical protein GKQ51_09480 [Azotobacter chroococcum]